MKSLYRVLMAAAAVAILTGGAPAQEKEGPGPEPAMTATEIAAVEKFFTLKVEEARQALKKHNYQLALKLIDAILVVNPQTRHKKVLQEMKIIASQGLLQQEVVRVYLYSPKKVYALGEKIEIKLRVRNISSGEVTFPHALAVPRNLGGVRKFAYTYELSGSSRMRATRTVIKQGSPITLKKNQVWEKSFEIDTSVVEAVEPVMRRYVLAAMLRPAEIIAGEEEKFTRPLTTGKIEIWAMPKKYAPYSKNAFANLKEALSFIRGERVPGELLLDDETTARVVLFYSVFFLSEQERTEALELLMEALTASAGQAARTITGSLTFLTNQPYGSSKEDWLNWWQRVGKKE